MDVHFKPSEVIVAGSCGEGLCKVSAGDVDMMLIPYDVMCVDERSHENGQTSLTLQTEYTSTSPGYVRLYTDRDVTNDPMVPFLVSKWCAKTDQYYLNSQLSNREFKNTIAQTLPAVYSGPSVSYFPQGYKTACALLDKSLKIKNDNVLALPFFSATFLEKWLKRERHHEWPSRELQREISMMEGYVVPVGHKKSEHSDIEWRISYTTAEKKLVSNMNDVQVKVYVVFKEIRKDRLKLICKNFSSYMVKNLVFWMLEETPTEDFTPETLVDRIMSAFHFLKQCLENKFLPCYMIEERNLFDGRLDPEEYTVLLKEVKNIISEGYEVISKNPRLSRWMKLTRSNPEEAKAHEEVEDIIWEFLKHGSPRAIEIADKCSTVEGFIDRVPNLPADIVYSSNEFLELARRLLQLLGFPSDVTVIDIIAGPAEIGKEFITRLQNAVS